ncbi:hypothetical protein GGF37_005974 [Kickxella alabastrina]|nr:hypothetical protein GGF37_005974 [Kickxella alabastrina]
MFAISKAVSGIFTATSISQLRVSAPAALQQCFYSSHKPKTNALKSKEKGKLRRQRVNKTDKPVQAKRGPRVSKL